MRKFIFLIPIFTLTACTDYSSAFDCPPKPGMSCKSISEIHDEIIESSIGDDKLIVVEQNSTGECEKCSNPTVSERQGLLSRSQNTILVSSGNSLLHRIPERVARIWVNGRTNEAGDYQSAHYVFVALKDDGWQRLKRQENAHDDI